MHLRYDHKLFRVLFTGPLIIAMTTIVALMFLFGKLSMRSGSAELMHPPVALLLHPAARIAVTEFTVHPSTVIGLVGLGALYHWRAGHAPAGAGGPLADHRPSARLSSARSR